jgi:hypothetical protein
MYIQQLFESLHHHAMTVLVKQLVAFMVHGTLSDPYNEFFISKSDEYTTLSELIVDHSCNPKKRSLTFYSHLQTISYSLEPLFLESSLGMKS